MRMDSDVWAGRWAVDGEGGGGDGGTFDAKYLKYIEAVLLIRNIYIYIYYIFITYFHFTARHIM